MITGSRRYSVVYRGAARWAALALSFLAGCGGARHPDLTTVEARRILSNEKVLTGKLSVVEVTASERRADASLACCYYKVSFVGLQSGEERAATADFYWSDGWKLQDVSYGKPPNVETIWISEGKQERN